MSKSEVLGQELQFSAFVGIDWADQKHAWCCLGRRFSKRITLASFFSEFPPIRTGSKPDLFRSVDAPIELRFRTADRLTCL